MKRWKKHVSETHLRGPGGFRSCLTLAEAYVEELALRTLGLELPEAYVASAKVLRRGARGQLHRPLMDPELSPRSAAHVVPRRTSFIERL